MVCAHVPQGQELPPHRGGVLEASTLWRMILQLEHPWLLGQSSSKVNTEAKFYFILIVAML